MGRCLIKDEEGKNDNGVGVVGKMLFVWLKANSDSDCLYDIIFLLSTFFY